MTVEEMAEPHTTLFVARDERVAVGCGALRRHKDGVSEVKRMYVRPGARNSGLGGLILAEIEASPERKEPTCSSWRPATGTRRHGAFTSAPAFVGVALFSIIRTRPIQSSTKNRLRS